MIATCANGLLPLTTILTPNSLEAAPLARATMATMASANLADCAQRLLDLRLPVRAVDRHA
jgi:hydroxymethylpyrimidine/phosphomethylpyrimidine kinase